MFRRRGFGRPLQRMIVDIPPALQRANELLAIGDYSGAAVAFEELARGAIARNGPRAPILLLQAGQARILAGQAVVGMGHLKQGISLFAARQQWPQLHRAGQHTIAFLNQRGQTEEAQQIQDYLIARLLPMPGGTVGPASTDSAALAEKSKPLLPILCSACGGPIRADEVEWVDENTVECPYCGSAVRAE